MIITKHERVIEEALNKYGRVPQLLIAVEELGEVQKEILKFIRGNDNLNDLEQELADLEIVLEYVYRICKPDKSNIERWKKFKIDKLEKNLKEGK